MLLDERGDLKIADFSGSGIKSIHGASKEPLVIYDIRSQKPGAGTPSIESDIFALGSAMFEMVAGRLPFHNLPDIDVASRFAHKIWPEDMKYIYNSEYHFLDTAIEGCWGSEFLEAQDVAKHIREFEPKVASLPPYQEQGSLDKQATDAMYRTISHSPGGENARQAHSGKRARRGKRSRDECATPSHSSLLRWIRRSIA